MSSHPDFLLALQDGYARCGVSDPGQGLVIAVSGGADSTALLHGTVRIWPDHREQIVAVHVDHQLRGSDSDADAEFVRSTADALGVRYILQSGDVQAEQTQTRKSLEEAARHVRYRLLTESAVETGFQLIVCAHHLDDQAETVLHNILRGSGLRGLAGMSWQHQLDGGVWLIRPCLQMSRDDIRRFADSQLIDYRDDEHNLSAAFTRNRLRHQLLPLLQSDFNAQVSRHLTSLAEQAADAMSVIEEFAERLLDESLLSLQPDACRLDCCILRRAPAALLPYAMVRLWVRQGWPRKRMSSGHWGRLVQAVKEGQPRAGHLPGDCRFETDAQVLRIFANSQA